MKVSLILSQTSERSSNFFSTKNPQNFLIINKLKENFKNPSTCRDALVVNVKPSTRRVGLPLGWIASSAVTSGWAASRLGERPGWFGRTADSSAVRMDTSVVKAETNVRPSGSGVGRVSSLGLSSEQDGLLSFLSAESAEMEC